MNTRLRTEADNDRLTEVIGFVDEYLEANGCSLKLQMQIDLCVEEIFVNIASYAYEGSEGYAEIELGIESGELTIVFTDSGVPYDPLKKPDPDTTLSADERDIGGLGIFLVKKTMDEVLYNYEDGKNVLTLKKKL